MRVHSITPWSPQHRHLRARVEVIIKQMKKNLAAHAAAELSLQSIREKKVVALQPAVWFYLSALSLIGTRVFLPVYSYISGCDIAGRAMALRISGLELIRK